MTNNTKVSEVWDNFRQQYDVTHTGAILAIECDSCDSDYGTTSWTTRAEANRVRELLGLTPSTRRISDIISATASRLPRWACCRRREFNWR